MAIKDYSTTPDLNTQISGINIAEGCAPSGINNAIRQLMADVKAEKEAKDAEQAAKDAQQDSAITAAQTTANGKQDKLGYTPVKSVNGVNADAAGDVALTKADIVESLGYTPLQTAPVTSVNGKTGAVTISSIESANGAYSIPYATCSTGSGTNPKVATVTNSIPFSLKTGSIVIVKFTNATKTGETGITLNVNSTGAKTIDGSSVTWAAGATLQFIYNGSVWKRM